MSLFFPCGLTGIYNYIRSKTMNSTRKRYRLYEEKYVWGDDVTSMKLQDVWSSPDYGTIIGEYTNRKDALTAFKNYHSTVIKHGTDYVVVLYRLMWIVEEYTPIIDEERGKEIPDWSTLETLDCWESHFTNPYGTVVE